MSNNVWVHSFVTAKRMLIHLVGGMRDASIYLMIHRTIPICPTTKNYPFQHVSSTEFETPVLEVLIYIRYHFQCSGLVGETHKKLTIS